MNDEGVNSFLSGNMLLHFECTPAWFCHGRINSLFICILCLCLLFFSFFSLKWKKNRLLQCGGGTGRHIQGETQDKRHEKSGPQSFKCDFGAATGWTQLKYTS